MTNQDIRKVMQEMGRKGGKKAAANMTAAQRRERAAKAAAVKYANKPKPHDAHYMHSKVKGELRVYTCIDCGNQIAMKAGGYSPQFVPRMVCDGLQIASTLLDGACSLNLLNADGSPFDGTPRKKEVRRG